VNKSEESFLAARLVFSTREKLPGWNLMIVTLVQG